MPVFYKKQKYNCIINAKGYDQYGNFLEEVREKGYLDYSLDDILTDMRHLNDKIMSVTVHYVKIT